MERVRAAIAAENWHEALRIAVKLQLGADNEVITRAWESLVRPAFLRQVGRDPDAALREGQVAMRRRFG